MSDTPASGFGKFVPGFEFLQGLASQAAGGLAQGLGQKLPSLPSLSHWVAPTFSVEDLEKRIDELRAVQFWLDQNAKALGATIQALEVQKMTLSTLKSMNFSMGDVASALSPKPGEGAAPSAAFPAFQVPPRASEPEPEAAPPAPAPARAPRRPAARKAAAAAPAAATAGGVVDPLQWWGALSQQFQQIATHALKDAAQQTALDATRQAASGLTEAALKTASGVGRAAARAVASAAQPAQRPKAAKTARTGKAAAASPPPARQPAAKARSPRR